MGPRGPPEGGRARPCGRTLLLRPTRRPGKIGVYRSPPPLTLAAEIYLFGGLGKTPQFSGAATLRRHGRPRNAKDHRTGVIIPFYKTYFSGTDVPVGPSCHGSKTSGNWDSH